MESGRDSNRTVKQPREAPRCRRYVVLAACVSLQFVTIGMGFGLSVMYVEVIQYFDSPRSEAALIESIYIGVTLAGGILWRWAVTSYGPGPCIILGAVITCVGLVASAFAVNVPMIIVLTGLVGGFGMSPGNLGSYITVGWIFHEDPGIPLILLTIGSSLGQFVFPYLFEVVIAEYMWNGAFLIMAGIALNLAICGVIIYQSRFYFKTGSDDKSSSLRRQCDPTLLTNPVLMVVLFCSLLLALTGNVEAYFLVDIMVIRGFERETGAFFTSMVGLGNFLGRIIGVLLRTFCKVPTVYHWTYVPLVVTAGHLLVVYVYDYGGLLGVVVMCGLSYGTTVAQTPAIIYEASGVERYPQAIALLNVMYGIGTVFSGLTGGLIKDEIGSYDPMFYLATGCSLFVSVATITTLCALRWTGSNKFTLKKRISDNEQKPVLGEKRETNSITYQSVVKHRGQIHVLDDKH